MSKSDWLDLALYTFIAVCWYAIGRMHQSRDDRNKALKAKERQLAEVLAQQTLRGRRGA